MNNIYSLSIDFQWKCVQKWMCKMPDSEMLTFETRNCTDWTKDAKVILNINQPWWQKKKQIITVLKIIYILTTDNVVAGIHSHIHSNTQTNSQSTYSWNKMTHLLFLLVHCDKTSSPIHHKRCSLKN